MNDVVVGQTLIEEVVGELSVFEYSMRDAEVRGAMSSNIVVVTREAYETMVRAGNPMALRLEQATLRSMARRLHTTGLAVVGKRLNSRQPIRPAGRDRRRLRIGDFIETEGGAFLHPLLFKGPYHIEIEGENLLGGKVPIVLVAWNWSSGQGVLYGAADSRGFDAKAVGF